MTKVWYFLLVLTILVVGSSVNALKCYQCLQLTCDSVTLCNSIKLSMSRIFFPRRQHLEFNPNTTCPEVPFVNTSSWSPYSQECRKSDSVCLQAKLEIITSFSGLRDSLALDRFSDSSSKGSLRACASRRFLLSMSEPTLEVKDDDANETLTSLNVTPSPKDKVTVREIFFHHFYVDHGTKDAVKCIQDNCNAKDPPKNTAPHKISTNIVLTLPFGVMLTSLDFRLKYLTLPLGIMLTSSLDFRLK